MFTDGVLLKGISGIELTRRAKALRPDLKVLLASGYSEEVFKHHGRRAQGTILLKKPYRRNDLASALQSVLQKPARMFPQMQKRSPCLGKAMTAIVPAPSTGWMQVPCAGRACAG
jgi:DNA-binding NarL/FixJ family response regulator